MAERKKKSKSKEKKVKKGSTPFSIFTGMKNARKMSTRSKKAIDKATK